jgi:hypothetical protein
MLPAESTERTKRSSSTDIGLDEVRTVDHGSSSTNESVNALTTSIETLTSEPPNGSKPVRSTRTTARPGVGGFSFNAHQRSVILTRLTPHQQPQRGVNEWKKWLFNSP